MKGIWWLGIKQTSHAYFLYPVVAVVLLLGAVTIALLLVDHWSVLLVLIALWVMAAIVATHFLFHDVSSLLAHHKSRQLQLAKHIPLCHSSWPRFPETPMPATPLIRVLETIDLSSTNIEHFLTSLPEEYSQTNEQV